MIIVIDDERTFAENFDFGGAPVDVYLRSADEAIAYLAKLWSANQSLPIGGTPLWIDELWFDHDLGSDDATVIARFLSELNLIGRPVLICSIYIHTQNPVGAHNLENLLKDCATSVLRRSLPPLVEQEPEYLDVKEWGNDEPIMRLEIFEKRS